MTRSFNNQAGVILVYVMSGMLGLMALCAAFLSSALTEHAAEAYAAEAEHALRFAETGIDFALHEVAVNHDFGGDGIGNGSLTIEGGTVAVTIAPPFNGGAGPYTLHSVGTHNRTRRAIDTVFTFVGGRFSSGFFGKDGITFSGIYMTDSYDSQQGSYQSQVGPNGYAGSHGDVISNGNISTSANVLIHGDARPGPGYCYIGSPEAVSGTTAPLPQPRVLEPYVYSPPSPTGGEQSRMLDPAYSSTMSTAGDGSGSTTLGTGTYRYADFTVDGDEVVTFTGNVTLYVDSSFTVSGSGLIVLAPGAHLTIHHGTGDFVVSGSGILNQSSNPLALSVNSATTTKVEISGSANFFGTAYAPSAKFVSTGGSNLYGAVVARAMNLSSAKLHYDTALGGGGGAGVHIVMTRATHP